MKIVNQSTLARRVTENLILEGPRRELENAYRQIDMYKRQIAALRSKQEGDKGFLKVDKLENDILTKNK